MHGTIFAELKKYVDAKLGGDAWKQLVQAAGTKNQIFMPIQEYPDEEAVKLVVAASKITKLPADAILEDFGDFIAPDLIGMYKSLIDPKWKTLDVIHNTEKVVHTVVRAKNPGAKPPQLQTTRPSADEVVLTYTSARKMCAVAKGIGKGLAKYFNEKITVSEPSCMTKGASACRISFKLAK